MYARTLRSRVLHFVDYEKGRTECGREITVSGWAPSMETPRPGVFRECVKCSRALSAQGL